MACTRSWPGRSIRRSTTRSRPSSPAWPTNDDLTLLVEGWPYAEFEANKSDVEGNYLKSLELAPEFSRNYFRKPFGPGWVLVGDAAYSKDFITAQGITDVPRRGVLRPGPSLRGGDG